MSNPTWGELPPPPPPSGQLPPTPPPGWAPTPPSNQTPWYRRKSGIIALSFIFPPLGLWWLWKQPVAGKALRWAVTGIAAFVWLVVVAGVAGGGSNNKSNSSASVTTPAPTATPTAASTAAPAVATAAPTHKATPVPTPAPTPAPTPVPTLAPTAVPTESQAQIVAGYESSCQSVTVTQMANDPSTYKGSSVTFPATIVDFVQDSSGNTTAMNVSDPNDATSLVLVQLSPTAEIGKMNKGDSITVWGDGSGSMTGTNSYGGTIHEATVNEVYLTDHATGYQDDSDPNPS